MRSPALVPTTLACFILRPLCGALLLAVAFSAAAQQFHVRNWDTANGLPDGTVTAIAQTPDGYLWVGTPKGLARFDGDRFTRIDAAEHTALGDPSIVSLLAGREGTLWIAGESGLIAQLANGKFRVCYLPEGTAPGNGEPAPSSAIGQTSRNTKTTLAIDKSGNVWAATPKGDLLQFTGLDATPTLASLEGMPGGRVRSLLNDSAGRIWLWKGTNACVFEDGHWTCATTGVVGFGGMLCPAGERGFWTADVSGPEAFAKLVRYDRGEGWSVSSLSIPTTPAHPSVSTMLQDRKGRLWLAKTWGGVYVRLQKGEWARVQTSGPLDRGTVRCLFEDRQGGIWAGTVGQGLHQVLDASVKMVLLPSEASDVHVTSVCPASDGALWMGTDKGLYRGGDSAPVVALEQLAGESVLSVLEDSSTNLWVGTRSGLFRRENTRFTEVPSPSNPPGDVRALYQDRSGGLWAGGSRGRLQHLRSNSRSAAFVPIAANSGLTVCSITEDPSGQIWVASWQRGSAIWRVDREKLIPADPQLQSIGQLVRTVLWDKDGVLWIGTQGDGFFRWHNRNLQRYTTADGLPDDVILGLMPDNQGNIWMPSRAGILGCSRLQLAEYVRGQTPPLLCTQLGVDEGMANRECTGAGQPVISRGTAGRVWVATMAGAAGFSPELLARSAPPAEVRLASLDVDGSPVQPGPEGFRVPASARRYQFRYSVPELASPNLLRFRYLLSGMDQNWVEAGAGRVASYSQLPPGNYHFRVMVGGADGSWRETRIPGTLRVLPRFWQTVWFRTVVPAAIIVSLMSAVALNERRKARRRLERLEARQAIEQVRRRIARDLHDELGSSITEIVQLGDLTLQPQSGRDALWSGMETMTTQARKLGIALDEIVWTMSSRNDTLPNLVGYLSNHAQEFFRHSGTRCRLDVTQNLPVKAVNSQTRHNLLLAVKEALNNVAKHSGADEVILRLHYSDGVLRLRLEDNGRGFDAAAVRHGEGLANMRERLQSIKGEVEFVSEPGRGTQVAFTLSVD